MRISGFQKMTLLDYPGKVACTLFTPGCNLRCPFCHNALLVTDLDDIDDYPPEEILGFLKKRQGILDGVAVTGGEPLLQKGVEEFLKKVRDLGFSVKLDTNGFFPEMLEKIVEAGVVDRVAVDIKNSPEKYALTAGVKDLDLSPVRETVAFLIRGTVEYEFRTTVVRELHEKEDIRKIGEWILGAENYFLQNFVDSGHLIGSDFSAWDRETLQAMKEIAAPFVKHIGLRGID